MACRTCIWFHLCSKKSKFPFDSVGMYSFPFSSPMQENSNILSLTVQELCSLVLFLPVANLTLAIFLFNSAGTYSSLLSSNGAGGNLIFFYNRIWNSEFKGNIYEEIFSISISNVFFQVLFLSLFISQSN